MSTPLIDPSGFPRADIDIAQSPSSNFYKIVDTFLVRIVRSQVIHLKNDHKDLMSRIEKGTFPLCSKVT
jgi:hypothetical protein